MMGRSMPSNSGSEASALCCTLPRLAPQHLQVSISRSLTGNGGEIWAKLGPIKDIAELQNGRHLTRDYEP